MDLICTHCREPWDNDTIHEEVAERNAHFGTQATYKSVLGEFYSLGCGAMFAFASLPHRTREDGSVEAIMCPDAVKGNPNGQAISAIYDLMGDDADGAMAFIEDMNLR